MVVKELDGRADTGDARAWAGYQAEKQMAHYLQRAFGERDDVYVLNHLRMERGGEVAQIDHLLIHRSGMIIVESKSVHDRVSVNEYGEWVRVFGGRRQGMASPIEQARRQARFLTEFLDFHAPQIAGKLLGFIQAHFGALDIDIVIAISDTGIIERPRKLELPEVCKADQASEKIKTLLAKQKRDTNLLTGTFRARSGRGLSRNELENLLIFLPANHVPGKGTINDAPLKEVKETKEVCSTIIAEATVAPTVAQQVCVSCGKSLTVKEAQYCLDKQKRFGDRFYCYQHQRGVRAAS